MNNRRRARPSVLELEPRWTLDRGITAGAVLDVLRAAPPRPRPPLRGAKLAPATVPARINAAFDAFQAEFWVQRDAYAQATRSGVASEPLKAAFDGYTARRAETLGQVLIGTFLKIGAASTARHGQASTAPNAQAIAMFVNPRVANLAANLQNAAPANAATEATIALDASAQDASIASARQGILNGASFLKLAARSQHR